MKEALIKEWKTYKAWTGKNGGKHTLLQST